MRPCDAEIDEQLRDRLGCHRGAAVGVQGELILGHALRVVGGVDEFLGEFAGLSGGDAPGDDVAGVDVDDDEQLVVDATLGALEFRDVPRPNLVGLRRYQLGDLVRRMRALAAAFTTLADHSEQAIHRRDRTQIDPVIQQPGPHLRWCQIAILSRTQHGEDLLLFSLGELVGRCRPWRGRAMHRAQRGPVVTGAGSSQQLARPPYRGHRAEIFEVDVDHFVNSLSVSALSERSSKSACAFPVISNANLVRCSSAVSLSLRARSLSTSTSAAARRVRLAGLLPARSRWLRHSEMCDEYKPSRRSNPPRSVPPLGSPSYSSRILFLYSTVKVRRDGLGAGSVPSGSFTTPSWARSSGEVEVIVISLEVPGSRPEGDLRLPQVSHISLTDRAPRSWTVEEQGVLSAPRLVVGDGSW